MNKQAPTIEWQIVERDADWERLQTSSVPDSTLDARHRRQLRRYFWCVAVLLLLLAGAGGWVSYTRLPPPAADGTTRLRLAAGEVAPGSVAPVALLPGDPATTDAWRQLTAPQSTLPAANLTHEGADRLLVDQRIVTQRGEQRVVQVVIRTQDQTYRQTRFYQRTGPDWRQVAPDAALWGSERSLETPYILYHFRQNDAPAVIAVAAQLDTLYRRMRRNFGLPLSLVGSPLPAMFGGDKLSIDVSVTQLPGQVLLWSGAPERIIVPSPAVYLAPVELTDAELLAQSIALSLLEQALAQASEQHAIGASWQPLLDGLRLWQLWDLDLPLAAWREQVVKWLYVDGSALGSHQTFVLPDRYRELCAAHLLWLLSPAQLNLPLTCISPEWEEPSFPLWRLRDPLTRLDQFPILASTSPSPGEHPGQAIALATLIQYAVATYGRERLPELVAGLGQYERWETLIPAVYGVSPAEFEAGWQAYLGAHYDVPARQ